MKFAELLSLVEENCTQRSYSCLMLDIGFLHKQIQQIQNKICPCEIYDLKPGHGLENEPHITVKYGIHSQCPKQVYEAIDLFPVKFKIQNISFFENENFDVLKFGIVSKDLNKINKQVCDNLDFTDKFPTYNPHSTIAYLMPGTGIHYKKMKCSLIGKEFTSNKFIFSDANGNKVTFTA